MSNVPATCQVGSSCFIPGTSAVHRADARFKLLSTLALALGVGGAGSWPAALPSAVVLCLIYRLAGVSGRDVASLLRPFVFFAVLALLFSHGHEGRTLVVLGGWRYTSGDAAHGVWVGVRLLGVVAAAGWLTYTTPPTALVVALGRMLAPLQRVGLPAADLTLVTFIALRFLPVFALEARQLQLAQAARGALLAGGPVGLWRRVTGLTVPLLAAVLRRADALSAALVARGYRPGLFSVAEEMGALRPGVMLLGCSLAATVAAFAL
jgi:energy-coupling factor transport system permease protein